MRRFLSRWWWAGLFRCRDHGYGLWRNVWCWVRGHGAVRWYNVSGSEPDMRCRYCGEDIG
jgi:hypothetical protein